MAIDANFNKLTNTINIQVFGQFDFSSYRFFRDVVETIPNSIDLIVVDLAATNYIDSSGLGMLLVLLHRARLHQKPVRIINAQAQVSSALKSANFDRLFRLHEIKTAANS